MAPMPRRVVHEDEQDAYTGWRRVYPWKPGERKGIKRRTHKRERREARVEIHDETKEES